MNITSMIALLQAAASLLAFAQSPAVASTTAQSAVNFAGNAVQVVAQATAPIGFAVPQNNSVWPNITDLANAPYLDNNGNYVSLGSSTISLIESDTSFGDINADGIDDAAVVVNRPSATGAPNYFLAAMLNQGGIMFNIADYPLGSTISINSHSVSDGKILINGDHYQLLGDQIEKLNQ